MAKVCHLIMVDDKGNHNKTYDMKQINDNQFEASWGRYGARKQTRIYSMSVWDSLYQQKLDKGYTDITDLKSVTVSTSNNQYDEIEDKAVRELVDALLRYANECVKRNYQVSTKEVTRIMIRKAQDSIDRLSELADRKTDCYYFNKELKRLFVIIPRQMKNVSDYLSNSEDDYLEVIDREQKLLDVMASLVDAEPDGTGECSSKKGKTILDAFGLKIRPCNAEEEANVRRKLTSESEHKFKMAFRIEQKDLEERYKKYVKEHHLSRKSEHFFWHGTRNQNVWSIMKNGMLLNPKAPITGKMFGYGLYFAPRAKKSIKYTSINGVLYTHGTSDEGFLFVMKVAYKNPLDVYSWDAKYQSYRGQNVRATGNDAIFAHKGSMLVNDEVIVYDEAQVCPRYLVVLK